MKPMLSFRFADHKKKVVYPWYLQPKINGVRLVAFGEALQSRSYGKGEAKLLGAKRLAHIREALRQIPSHFLIDGEAYVHGWSLQKINGAFSVNSAEDQPSSHLLEYHIFDMVNTKELDEPFAVRAEYLSAFSRRLDAPLRFVETQLVSNEIEGDALYGVWKHFGYEGAVYKNPSESYGFAEHCGNQENRWAKTLKRKDYLDLQARCIGVIPGEGKYEDVAGSLIFEMENGKRFCAGSGLYDSQREEFIDHPPLGRFFQINYFMLSDEGIPLQPTIEADLG